MMRKFSDMFIVCVWIMLIMVTCALLMNGLDPIHRVALLVTGAVVGCVFMECESRVQRAQAPLILREESVAEKTKPPEGDPK